MAMFELAAWAVLAGILFIGAGVAMVAPWAVGYTLIATGIVCVAYGGIGHGIRR